MFHHELGILDTAKFVNVQSIGQVNLLQIGIGPLFQVHIKGDGINNPLTARQPDRKLEVLLPHYPLVQHATVPAMVNSASSGWATITIADLGASFPVICTALLFQELGLQHCTIHGPISEIGAAPLRRLPQTSLWAIIALRKVRPAGRPARVPAAQPAPKGP